MTKNTVAQFCAIAAVVTLPSLSFAGTPAKKCCQPAPEKLAESAISGDIGLTIASSYYSRGIVQTRSSASYQPYLNLNFKAYEGDGIINKAVVSLGLWNEFTLNPADRKAAGSRTNSWFESDFTPTIALTSGKFTLAESLLIFTYPSDVAPTAMGLQTKLSFDDTDLLGAWALHPSITHVMELEGKIGSTATTPNFPAPGTGSAVNNRGSYWELAVAPSVPVGPVTLSLPTTLAFGSAKFYNRNGLGYFSSGLNAAYELPVSKQYGKWTVNTGVTYYHTPTRATGNVTSDDVVVSAGLGVAF